MALLVVSAIFLSPLGWTYYVWWALPPLAASLMRAGAVGSVRKTLLVAAAAIFGTPTLLVPVQSDWALGHLVSGTQVIGLTCLWLACVLESAIAVRAGLPAQNAWYGRVASERP
jgi:hypothetical protein